MVRDNPAYRDQNTVPTALGVSSSDSITPIMIRVDTITNYILTDSISSSNSATVATKDKRDENTVPTVYGISNDDDVTLVPIRTDTNGRLLTQSN